jgi:hypothetical protein
MLVIDVNSRYTAEDCVKHPWMAIAEGVELPKVAPKARFRRAVRMVRFLCRLQKMKDLNREVDKMALRKRPFRDRQVSIAVFSPILSACASIVLLVQYIYVVDTRGGHVLASGGKQKRYKKNSHSIQC